MPWLIRNKAALVAVLLSSVTLFLSGCASSQPLTLEEQAHEINKSLICPVCPGETIDQSQATLAKQMREQVLEQLKAGKLKEEVIQFFVDRYGESILAAPPKRGFNLIAWVFPPSAVAVGLLFMVFLVVRLTRQTQTPQQDPEAPSPTLGKYLSAVDEEMKERMPGVNPEKGKE